MNSAVVLLFLCIIALNAYCTEEEWREKSDLDVYQSFADPKMRRIRNLRRWYRRKNKRRRRVRFKPNTAFNMKYFSQVTHTTVMPTRKEYVTSNAIEKVTERIKGTRDVTQPAKQGATNRITETIHVTPTTKIDATKNIWGGVRTPTKTKGTIYIPRICRKYGISPMLPNSCHRIRKKHCQTFCFLGMCKEFCFYYNTMECKSLVG